MPGLQDGARTGADRHRVELPIHSIVASRKAGECPVCRRDLVRVTMSVAWTCAGRPTGTRLEPFRCDDGTPATVQYTARPHGNHNPQHGGQFFMAPDNWHHLEGSYPRAGVFRVYLYDDYSKPLAPEQMQRVSGRISIGRIDMPLVVADDGQCLEAPVPATTMPLELTAKLKFEPNAPEHRFDFAFAAYSIDRMLPGTRGSGAAADDERSGPARAPASIEELAVALHARAAQVDTAVNGRAFSEIWVPALQVKEIALLIDAAVTGTDTHRLAVEAAVKQIVRSAWLLDAVGDQGNAIEIGEAHARLTAAIARLDASLAVPK